MTARTGIGALFAALALGVLLSCALAPQDASPEYVYTARQLFKFAFLPFLLLGVWGLLHSLKTLGASIAGGFANAGAFIKTHKGAAAKALIAALILFLALFIWKYSASLLIDLFLSLLPFASLACLIWLFRLDNQEKPLFWAIVWGALLWSLLVWVQANVLSWLNLLSGGLITAFWIIFFCPLAWLLFRRRGRWRLAAIRGWDWVPALIALLTLATSLVYPPNNYDVLSYHMPRVLQWLQNGSLAPFATPNDRQIGMAPFNAIIELQSYAPARLDYFINSGQWLAYIGVMIGVRQIARAFGMDKRARGAALVFSATLPTAIIQASNSESSLIVSFFLAAMAWACALCWKEKKASLELHALLGLCLGFAILSKGSAYVIAFPFVLIIAWRCLASPKKLLLKGAAAACLVILINAPHLCRAYLGEGSIIAGGERNALKRPTLQSFVNNSLYNFVSNHPVLALGGGKEALINFSASLGIRQDDLEIFPWGGLDNLYLGYLSTDPGTPNPAQSVFLIFVLGALLFGKFRPPPLYTGAVIAGFILFNLLLTWHSWSPRIQMPLFLLAAPICGQCIASLKSRRLAEGVLAVFCLAAALPLFMGRERPLLPKPGVFAELNGPRHFSEAPREELMINDFPMHAKDYVEAAEYIAARKPEKIGVKIGTNGVEYPLWQILRSRLGDGAPTIVQIFPGSEEAPEYVFDWERIEQDDVRRSPRVLKCEGGACKTVFEGGNYKPE